MDTKNKYQPIVDFIKKTFKSDGEVSLHPPIFNGNEQKYVNDTVVSANVASKGKYIRQFEQKLCEITGTKYAITTVNGTSALHISLLVLGVSKGDEVLTQSLSFVATSNAISYCGATPHFIDVDIDTLGMSPSILKEYLSEIAIVRDGVCYNKYTNNRISACVPVHTCGFPMRIKELVTVCNKYNIPVIEDAAQALGSLYETQHLGTFGKLGIFSFNGNKIITSGGGGVIITNDEKLAKKIRYLINQAKDMHDWEFNHSEIGYNYRMPNLNAALGCAQLEQLDIILKRKKTLHSLYKHIMNGFNQISSIEPQLNTQPNYWLQTILFSEPDERDKFLKFTHQHNIQTRAIWTPLNQLPMYVNCPKSSLKNTLFLATRLVSLPSNLNIEVND